MRITKVDIPDLPAFGLKNIWMDRLGRVVILAGKNGAGKSRLLERLVGWSREMAWPYSNRTEFKRANLKANRVANPAISGWWHDPSFVDELNARFSQPEQRPRVQNTLRDFFDIETDSGGHPTFVHFVPKELTLSDPWKMTPAQQLEQASAVELVGVNELARKALARIQFVQNRWWSAQHPQSTVSAVERAAAVAAYEALNSLVKRFLDVELERDLNDAATLFGFPLGQAPLSDGQKVLLQFCVAVHAQADKLSELIVLMDEPENHLHPGAMLDAITEIERALPNGQLWIATHSIPLLAHFDPDTIWWIEDGTVQHAGSQPEMVLHGLIGDEERIERLGDFLGLPAALAANHFAHQCLLPPGVVGEQEGDPQTRQIAHVLKDRFAEKRLRILDFGAGRGRLISALRESGLSSELLLGRIDYIAFDASPTHREECTAAIERVYGSAQNRYFTAEPALRGQIDAGSVDVIVMCNVLHEIDPQEWTSLFSASGLIRNLLGPSGALLVVEDMEIRIGEKAHQRGFLVMDTPDLKTLFGIKEQDTAFTVSDARGDGRLKAHLIPADCLERMSETTLRNTLEGIRHFANQEIRRLRQEPPTYRSGRLHALHVHRLANATLALA